MVHERLNRAVGLVVLFLVSGAAAGVLLVGDKPVMPVLQFDVEFDRVGQLRVGAPVKIANMEVGGVLSIRFIKPSEIRAGGKKTKVGRVRVAVWIKKRYRKFVRVNSQFIVTSANLIGARHLEIVPPKGEPGRVIRAGDAVLGDSPSLLDRMLQMTYDNLTVALDLIKSMRPEWAVASKSARRVRRTAEEFRKEKETVKRIVDSARRAQKDAKAVHRGLMRATGDWKRFEKLRWEIKRVTRKAERALKPVRQKARRLSAAIDNLQRRVKQLNVRGKIKRVKKLWKLAERRTRTIRKHLKRVERALRLAEGTVGAFAQDKEIYDDFKATQKKLKHTPWSPIARPKKSSTKGLPVP
jgi:ABC-type transporter Mla subunit MlaD